MGVIVTFGELLLRLAAPGKEMLLQSPLFEVCVGGGEANVAVALAHWGYEPRYLSVVPDNELGAAALAELRRFGVDTASVVRKGERVGLYFAESGANQRPAKVIYDRAHSALAEAQTGAIDWKRVLADASWFHTSGITPAVSASAAALTLEAVQEARRLGVTVSLDLNYRAKLWKYGKRAPEVMTNIVRGIDILMANEEDCQRALGIGAAVLERKIELKKYEELTRQVQVAFPQLKKIAITLRESHSADHNDWSAVLRSGDRFLVSKKYEIRHIVDRIGAGDAFAAGLIHGLLRWPDDAQALEFAVAASCLKHSLPGDFSRVSEKEVLDLLAGEESGRVRR